MRLVRHSPSSLIRSITANPKLVLSTYTFRIAGTEPTEWQAKGVAIAGFTLATVG